METIKVVYFDPNKATVEFTDAQGFTATHTLTMDQICDLLMKMNEADGENIIT